MVRRIVAVPLIGLWLSSWLLLAGAARAQAPVTPPGIAIEARGSWKDPASLPGVPGYRITEYQQKVRDRFAFEDGDGEPAMAEGRYTRIQYRPNPPARFKAAVPTPERIVRHYEKVLAGAGGEVLFNEVDAHRGTMTLKWARDGRETWARIRIEDGGYTYGVVLIETPAAFRILIEREPCEASGSGAYRAQTALKEGMPLLAWLGGEGNIVQVRACPPRINTKLPLTETLVRDRFARSVCMDSQKDAWHYAPYTTGTVHLKDGTVARFTMFLSGLLVDGHLFGVAAP